MICFHYTFAFILSLLVSGIHSHVRFGEDAPAGNLQRKLMVSEAGFSRSRSIMLPSARPDKEIGEKIEFQLFDGETMIGVVNHIVDRGEEIGGTWAGTLYSSGDSESFDSSNDWFTLSCYMEACTANLELESKRTTYVIRPDPMGTTYGEDDPSIFLMSEVKEKLRSGTRFHPSLVNHISSNVTRRSNLRVEAALDNDVDKDLIIDIGVIYTPEALAYMGNSEAAIKSQIYLANDEANQILQRSAVSLRIRIVFCFRTADANFVEPGGDQQAFTTMLYWLRNTNDGYLDEAHEYREQYGADFVLLVNLAGGYSGLAFTNPGPSPDYAFGSYNVYSLFGMNWMHEMGHIQGCYHDRFSGSQSSDPNWDGYGNCWEDSSRNDCTCYSSVMVYVCNTVPNHCTYCLHRNYLANYNVKDAGNPTGLPTASCGLHIHNRRYTPISYRKSIHNCGLILSVSPPAVLISLCSTVNITGWMLSFGPGDRVVSVTLAGVPATILSQTNHTVFVRAPNVTSPSIRAGDVIVTSKLGRVTISRGTFKFSAMEGYYTTDLSSMSIDKTVWTTNGPIPWTIQPFQGPLAFIKGSSTKDTDVAELITTRLLTATASRPCYDMVKSISFKYWAYSQYAYCFDKFTLSARTGSSNTWTVIFTGTASNDNQDGNTPWLNSSTILLPDDTRQVKFNVYTVDLNNCRFWTPLYLTDISLHLSTRCVGYKCPGLAYALPPPPNPTLEPSMKPTLAPTSVPSKPTVIPTSSPTTVPTASPNTTAIFSLAGPTIFNGQSTYFQYPKLSYGITDKFTISFWINTQTTDAYLVSLGRTETEYLGEFGLQLQNGYLLFSDYGNDIAGIPLFGFYTYSYNGLILGTRTHVVVVKDSVKLTYYIDGAFGGTGNSARSVQYNNKGFCLGSDRQAQSAYFKGTMDHVAVYRDALNQNQISNLFSQQLSAAPSASPITSKSPTVRPSASPSSSSPSSIPTTSAPTDIPTVLPSTPTADPSIAPSTPSVQPTLAPSSLPTESPTTTPTALPSSSTPSKVPVTNPTTTPTTSPSSKPSVYPSAPSRRPSSAPSNKPSTLLPTLVPSKRPSIVPSRSPSKVPTSNPTMAPSLVPSLRPSVTPSFVPSRSPTKVPTSIPSKTPTLAPSSRPSVSPTLIPTKAPSFSPTVRPTRKPTAQPSSSAPTLRPSSKPSVLPSARPSTSQPTRKPTATPSSPSTLPSKPPSAYPSTHKPSSIPTQAPSPTPTDTPSSAPTASPTPSPTTDPSQAPSPTPTDTPSSAPTASPTPSPTTDPSQVPSSDVPPV